MHTTSLHLVLLLLALAIDALFCLLVGAAAAVLARLGGAGLIAAVQRGATAFAGALTVSLALLTFVLTAR